MGGSSASGHVGNPGRAMSRPAHDTLLQRFVSKAAFIDPDDCWQWTDATHWSGYGVFWTGNRCVKAHRFAYEIFGGPIPEGLVIDHLCRNPGCVNPTHLQAVTQYENFRRGNAPAAVLLRSTHCSKGHPFSGDNLHVRRCGRRVCLTCRRAAAMARYRRIYGKT